MRSFWPWFLWHAGVGFLVALLGYVIYRQEKKRPKSEQRTAVIVLAFAIMLAGVVYGLGVGDGFLFEALIHNT